MNLKMLSLVTLLMATSVPGQQAYALEPCAMDLEQINSKLAILPLPAVILSEVQSLRDQGQQLCIQGSIAEGLALLIQAKNQLGLK